MMIADLLPSMAQAWIPGAGASTPNSGLLLVDLGVQLAHRSILFAQRARWERLGDRFQNNREIDWGNLLCWLGLALSFAVVMFVLIKVFNRRQKQTKTESSQDLFVELCHAHELTWKTRRLLQRLAKELKLAEPALLFLDPDLFASDTLPAALANQAEPLAQLRDQLFATS